MKTMRIKTDQDYQDTPMSKTIRFSPGSQDRLQTPHCSLIQQCLLTLLLQLWTFLYSSCARHTEFSLVPVFTVTGHLHSVSSFPHAIFSSSSQDQLLLMLQVLLRYNLPRESFLDFVSPISSPTAAFCLNSFYSYQNL